MLGLIVIEIIALVRAKKQYNGTLNKQSFLVDILFTVARLSVFALELLT